MTASSTFKSFDTIFSPKARWVMCVLALAIACLSLTLSISNRGAATANVQKFCAQVQVLNNSITSGRSNTRLLYQSLLNDALARINTHAERPGDRANVTTYSGYIHSIHAPITIDCKVLSS